MTFTLTLIFLIIGLIKGEMKKEGFVVRESSAFEMECNHGLENISRIIWKYIATNDIQSEMIYDSQSDKALRNGFEVSCKPHETFISICILKLIQARTEDSGKYICYVGDKSETKLDSNLKPIVEVELVVRAGTIFRTMVVNQGDSVILPCEHNIKNVTRARWSHVSLHGVMNYNLVYINGRATSHDNYEGLCEPHELSCNLKILQANKESAGRYICMVGESLDFEKKYGLDQMTYFVEVQLVVGELFCNENMNKDLTLIGENDCYGIEADVLNLKCSFNYFGNINYNLLHLRWTEKFKFNSLENKLNSSLIRHEMKGETNKISIQTNLSVAYEMQNSIFQCVLDDTLVKPCQLREFRTQYLKNVTERSSPIHSNDLRNMKCSANKSENVQCSYYWVYETTGAKVENPYAILLVENMNLTGNYTCIAKCNLGESKACIIKAMEFEIVHKSRVLGLIIGLIAALLVVMIIVLVIITAFMKRRYLRSRRKNVTGSLFEATGLIEKSPIPLEVNETNVESPSKRDIDNKHSALLRDKTNVKQNNKCLPTATISHSASLNPEATELIKKSASALEVKETLVERTSENGDIVIYKSENTSHARVLIIDNALWDSSFEKPSLLEFMALELLRFHWNPKKVLVFGRCEARIVRGLLKRPGVDSIDVYNKDEELSNFYCKYFPELACYLDKSNVQRFNGGVDFLRNQKNYFDFIVTRTPCKSVSNNLFSKQFIESVKSALKGGGIAILIVSGQDDTESISSVDFVEHDIQHLCKELFPVVKYFKLQNFYDIDHPSALTRFLICGLDKKFDIEAKFKEMLKCYPTIAPESMVKHYTYTFNLNI